jgi:uncharacterized Rmd1/YagE family protein
MRCSSYSSGGSYDLIPFVENLVSKGLEPKHFDDVIHVQKDLIRERKTIHIFYFAFGYYYYWEFYIISLILTFLIRLLTQ